MLKIIFNLVLIAAVFFREEAKKGKIWG